MIGKIISGKIGEIIARIKSDSLIETGQLVTTYDQKTGTKIIYQVIDLFYGSQISQQNLELICGLSMEDDLGTHIFDSEIRNYSLMKLKPLITIKDGKIIPAKSLTPVFSDVYEINNNDLAFLEFPSNKLLFGNLRSGSVELHAPVYLDGKEVFSHHVLVTATTGKGKSVFLKNILWNSMEDKYCGHLVFDPHDEYFGRNELGLKDHPCNNVSYYSINPVLNTNTLVVHLSSLKPNHFFGAVNFSDAQMQAISCYNKEYSDYWIEAAILQKPFSHYKFDESTLNVISRRLCSILDIKIKNNALKFNGIFRQDSGETTVDEIIKNLISSKTVIIDTSKFSGSEEILLASIIITKIYENYKRKKQTGELKNMPVISIVLEEAPRVIGKEVLSQGPNIFGTIAREGRKFNIGLIAITQLPSLIPREILANINTKIILGIEMAPERQAIIESASQDLSDDSRNIASLDKGEAIISSNFSKFALPIKIPFFNSVVKEHLEEIEKIEGPKIKFNGIKMN
jgi:uncharacterized protein